MKEKPRMKTIEELALDYAERKTISGQWSKPETTLPIYLSEIGVITGIIGNLLANQITKKHLRQLRRELKKRGLCEKSIRTRERRIYTLLYEAKGQGIIDKVPFNCSKPKSRFPNPSNEKFDDKLLISNETLANINWDRLEGLNIDKIGKKKFMRNAYQLSFLFIPSPSGIHIQCKEFPYLISSAGTINQVRTQLIDLIEIHWQKL